MGEPVTLNGSALRIDDLVRIARDPLVKVRCESSALDRVRKGHEQIQKIADRYKKAFEDNGGGVAHHKPLPHVYGVTTGFGEFKKVPINPNELEDLQRNILLSHRTGVGDSDLEEDPGNYFSADVVRAVLVLRMNTFLKGHSGVRTELVACIEAMLNEGVIPLVPTKGSVGSSGDLCPLAHLFSVLIGEGHYYRVRSSEHVGTAFPEVFKADALPDSLRIKASYKEGLALTNGPMFCSAILALCVHEAQILANTADIAAALTLEALCGNTRAFDPKVHAARQLPGQMDSAANLLALLNGYDARRTNRTCDVQDAYSLRCAPAVHGASRDAVAYAKMVAEREINAATDNPLFFPEAVPCDLPKGCDPYQEAKDYFSYSAGNFHGQPIGMAADFLTIAVAELANISERRTQMLLDPHNNRNLPANLAPMGGLNSGFMIAQYTSASLVSENKVLSHPASVDSIPTSANVEDHVAMSTVAARKLRTVLGNAQAVLAIELLTAAQAVEWRMAVPAYDDPDATRDSINHEADLDRSRKEATVFREAVEDRPAAIAAKLSRGTGAAYRKVRDTAKPMFEDRSLDGDIRRVRRIVADGTLLTAVDRQLETPLQGIPTLRPHD
ncbi:MAG: aromatic amino acid lyase [Phycisphaerales bacterium]|nr:aromatic amino acid lyase [Phycisphaerales bacterium]